MPNLGKVLPVFDFSLVFLVKLEVPKMGSFENESWVGFFTAWKDVCSCLAGFVNAGAAADFEVIHLPVTFVDVFEIFDDSPRCFLHELEQSVSKRRVCLRTWLWVCCELKRINV